VNAEPSTSSASSRLLFLAIAGLLACASALGVMQNAIAEVAFRLVTDGSLWVVWMLSAWGWGRLILDRSTIRLAPMALSIATRCAAGLGLLSLMVLGAGVVGWLNQFVAIAFVSVGFAVAAARLVEHRVNVASRFRTPAGPAWWFLLAVPPVTLMGVAGLLMPGLLWGDEPHGFDVTAYHLQLPREWLEAGRISFLHHNLFSGFPLGVEMQFLLGMTLRGDAWAGSYFAQWMHAGYVLLTILAIYGGVRHRGRLRATIACVAFIVVPWPLLLGAVAYNDAGLMLFATLAVLWAVRARSAGQFRLAGTMVGLAFGVKYTGAVALIPALLVGLIRRSRLALWIVVGAVSVASPWLVRNFFWTGNPTFPLATSVFGAGQLDGGQVERFAVAHRPRDDQQSVGRRLLAFKDQVLTDWRFGAMPVPIVLGLGVIAGVLCVGNGQARALSVGVIVWCGVWLVGTHLQGRFFTPAIPLLAMLIALPTIRCWMPIAIAACVLTLAVSLNEPWQRVARSPAELVGFDRPNLLREDLARAVDESTDPIYLLGDAQAFLVRVDSSRLRYRTVFDVASDKPFLDAWLGVDRPDQAWVWVDPGELRRYSKTYLNLPPIPDWVDRLRGPTLMRLDQITKSR
jgi:hypothetical protein